MAGPMSLFRKVSVLINLYRWRIATGNDLERFDRVKAAMRFGFVRE
jgi:hypothetical protein